MGVDDIERLLEAASLDETRDFTAQCRHVVLVLVKNWGENMSMTQTHVKQRGIRLQRYLWSSSDAVRKKPNGKNNPRIAQSSCIYVDK